MITRIFVTEDLNKCHAMRNSRATLNAARDFMVNRSNPPSNQEKESKMKKIQRPKLHLPQETVRSLSAADLRVIEGGYVRPSIMGIATRCL